MARHQLSAQVQALESFTDDIFCLSLLAPEVCRSAAPGQFVMVRAGEGLDPLLRRPFSVYRVDETGILQILFKVVGRGTDWLARLRPGEYVDVLGPLGQGFSLLEQGGVCLVGGGIGVAPLFFLAQRQRSKQPEGEIELLLGARTKIEVTALAQGFANLGVTVRLATDDGSAGHHGLVGELLTALPGDGPDRVFACGPHPMLAAVAGICQENGWPCQVSSEAAMACGLGACLGCAQPAAGKEKGYLHVCKQGPVFDAGDIQW
jgi:dihydroorotate dehydrogenase electron transfer subunit